MRVFRLATAALLCMAGAAFIAGEADVSYLVVASSPFLLVFGASSVWLLWKRATAPKWTGSPSLNATMPTHDEVDCPPEKTSSEAIVSNKQAIVRDDDRAGGTP